MNKIIKLIISLILLLCSLEIYAEKKPKVSTALNEMYWVEMSNTDVNRVICSTPIIDIVASDEKPIHIKYRNGEAYIKFLVERNKHTKRKKYFTKNTEFYVVCEGDMIYPVMGVPKKISSRTIRLLSTRSNNKPCKGESTLKLIAISI